MLSGPLRAVSLRQRIFGRSRLAFVLWLLWVGFVAGTAAGAISNAQTLIDAPPDSYWLGSARFDFALDLWGWCAAALFFGRVVVPNRFQWGNGTRFAWGGLAFAMMLGPVTDGGLIGWPELVWGFFCQVIYLGWTFHHRYVASIPGAGYLYVTHHAVWHSPPGHLVDVTPYPDALHRPLSPSEETLFLMDDRALPVTRTGLVAPLPLRYFVLDDDPALAAYVEHLNDEELEECRKIYGVDAISDYNTL